MVILSQDEWCEEAIGLLSRYKEDELQLTVILQTGLLFSSGMLERRYMIVHPCFVMCLRC